MVNNIGLFPVIRREIRRLVSHPIYVFTMVIAPLFCYFLFTSLMKNGLPTNLPVAVVNLDGTSTSRNVIRQLDVFSQSQVVMESAQFAEARSAMQEGKVYAVFVIPRHFTRDLVNGEQPKISFYTNNTFFIASSLVFKDMKTVSVLVSGAANRKTRLAKGQELRQIMAQLQPIVVDSHPLSNPWMNYSIYLNNILLPGVLQLLVLLLTVYSIGIEIKQKTTLHWLHTGGDSMTVSIIGKLLPHTVIFTLVGVFFQVLLYKYLHFPLMSGVWPMVLALMLMVMASQALGVFFISLLPVLRLGLSAASLIGVISVSMSGFSFPVFAMAKPLQVLSHIFPLRHYFLIYVDQALNGISMYYSRIDYLVLMGFMLLPLPFLPKLKHALKYKEYKM
ncbi:MAG: ABC transporter permease [Bacteroidota bacterium]|nr:ABC transporter permease [Bacteroidota bacterium]